MRPCFVSFTNLLLLLVSREESVEGTPGVTHQVVETTLLVECGHILLAELVTVLRHLLPLHLGAVSVEAADGGSFDPPTSTPTAGL